MDPIDRIRKLLSPNSNTTPVREALRLLDEIASPDLGEALAEKHGDRPLDEGYRDLLEEAFEEALQGSTGAEFVLSMVRGLDVIAARCEA